MLRQTALVTFVGKYHIQNTILTCVHILIVACLIAAGICFTIAAIEYLRSKISAHEVADIKRSLVFIILGILLGIGLLLLWTVGKKFAAVQ